MNLDKLTIYILIFIILIVIYLVYENRKIKKQIKMLQTEGLDVPQTTLEALQTLGSMYNKGELNISKINVTSDVNISGNLNVIGKSTLGSSKIGNWEIRNDRIGIPNRGDLHLHTDNWIRLKNYNTDEYAGSGTSGGFAGKNLWCSGGSLSAQNVNTQNLNASGNTNLIKEDEDIIINNKTGRNHYSYGDGFRFLGICGNIGGCSGYNNPFGYGGLHKGHDKSRGRLNITKYNKYDPKGY